MPIVPLFGLGQQGKAPTVTAQRHLNLFAEFVPDADKTKVAFYGTPGWTLFSSANGDTPIRGWIAIDDLIYYVHRGTFYSINNAGTRTSIGTLNTTSGKVDLAYDGAVIMIVDGTNGYTYTIASTTFAQISDGQFPNGANTCTWLAAQFVCDAGDGSDSFYISPDGSSWDALDFASAETAPDGLVRVFADHGEILLFGTATLEPWGNVGAQDFPFAAIQGGVQEVGLAARWALCKFDSGIAFLGKNKQGQVQVYRMDGYQLRPISTPEIEALINAYAAVSDATMMSFMDRGHPFLILNFPTPSKSWMYDATTKLWSPRESGLNGARFSGELAIDFLNKIRMSDYSSGNIYTLSATTYTENGTAIAREIVGKHFFSNYDRVVVDELRVDFETGVGLATGQGNNPQAMLSYSKDNGRTWSAEAWKSIGMIGQYLDRVVWRRLGVARDWLFKIRITDPVPVVITGAYVRAQDAGT